MEIEELLSYCQITAIHNRLLPDAQALYRKFCRQYSKKFYTPLPQVMELDSIHVIQSVYEDSLENMDLEDDEDVAAILERILMLEDPNYEAVSEEDLQDFIDEAEQEEEERVDTGLSLHKALLKKEAPKAPAQAPKELPKNGGINLSYLSESKNEG